MTAEVLPPKAGWPVAISYRTTPKDSAAQLLDNFVVGYSLADLGHHHLRRDMWSHDRPEIGVCHRLSW